MSSGFKNRKKYGDLFYLFISLSLLLLGFVLVKMNKSILAIDGYTQQVTGYDGWLIIFLSAIIFVVYYYTIDPFSPLRNIRNKKRGR